VSESSLRTLASLGFILSDPRAAPVTDALVADRLRAQGANLLAPTPFH
jgi:hypothetical protein